MNTIETIKSRRSIRKYTGEAITDGELHTLLDCAMSGPVCVNARDWAFIAVRDKAALSSLAGCIGGPASMLPGAAAAIVVCGDRARSFPPARDYWIVDASIATQNIILAAAELGIGSVWLGTWPQLERVEAIRALFSLPEDVIPLSVVSLGRPAAPAPGEKAPFEADRVHYERW